jgi:hypothetical protein
MSFRDLPAPETKPTELADMLARVEDQMRRMHDDLDSRLDAITESLEARGADEEAEALAAERIRSGAADRSVSCGLAVSVQSRSTLWR